VCLCSYHHTRVHEGGYSIEHVGESTQRQNEQFIQQQHNDDINLFDFEQSLRNDKKSFNTVRKLSPTRFRYRILDSHGRVITGRSSDKFQVDVQNRSLVDANQLTNQSVHHLRNNSIAESFEYTRVCNSDATRTGPIDNTSVDTGDSTLTYTDHYSTIHAPAFTYETPSNYGMNA
ncbi:MAG: hypothetical protein V3U65_05000, partial [Granulosicoccaceae bacterium]